MTRTYDRRNNGRTAKKTVTPCTYCTAPATEIALPSGDVVCSKHGDSRS